MARNEERGSGLLGWTRRISLRHRILAVNIFAVAIFAGSILYLDSFRASLTQARIDRARSETEMIAHTLSAIPEGARAPILVRLGQDSRARLRVYGRDGNLEVDSWTGVQPTYSLRDPTDEPWYREVARWLDNGFDAIVGAERPPLYVAPAVDVLSAWPAAVAGDAQQRADGDAAPGAGRHALIAAARRIDDGQGGVLLLTINARDVRHAVRSSAAPCC